ncbi:hypothetical protein HF086_001500, partial [Spodoptera exigua]
MVFPTGGPMNMGGPQSVPMNGPMGGGGPMAGPMGSKDKEEESPAENDELPPGESAPIQPTPNGK